jgi:hypothetical protein
MASPNSSRRSSLRGLRHSNFALFFAGNRLSNCGTWSQNIALALLVYRLTESSFCVGVANFAQFIGVVLRAPGPVADQERGRVMALWSIAFFWARVRSLRSSMAAARRCSVHAAQRS